ncbi:sam-dependent methyltransferase [Anaeramoeba flamelloides]|uniref:Sam-dependent methyltransferase n=1 Tax=Anaeramoeba flamelloides TaxID=1746091 RepID=A0ABQ8YB10_9EUKA|nr:sam-dependent methyltransferase [Anaeramoeba flamelloides]
MGNTPKKNKITNSNLKLKDQEKVKVNQIKKQKKEKKKKKKEQKKRKEKQDQLNEKDKQKHKQNQKLIKKKERKQQLDHKFVGQTKQNSKSLVSNKFSNHKTKKLTKNQNPNTIRITNKNPMNYTRKRKEINQIDYNPRMNPKNPYFNNKPNFLELSNFFPSLKPFVYTTKKGFTGINWKSNKAIRINYLCWIDDLLEISKIKNKKQIIGIDIGTSASCIFPLLGKKMFDWNFLGTEIDEKSIEYSIKNINCNNFVNSIEMRKVEDPNKILTGILKKNETFDFTVCNPPFFSSIQEKKEREIKSKRNFVGSINEVVTQGGEEGFLLRMVNESLQFQNNITWFTSMVGKKSTILIIKKELNKHKVPIIKTSTLFQGKTIRWVIAWSFCKDFKQNLQRHSKKIIKGKKKRRRKNKKWKKKTQEKEL